MLVGFEEWLFWLAETAPTTPNIDAATKTEVKVSLLENFMNTP